MVEHFKWRKAEDKLPSGVRAVLVRHGIDNRITSICTWNNFTWLWETAYDYSRVWAGDRHIPFEGTEWCYILLPEQAMINKALTGCTCPADNCSIHGKTQDD